MDDYTYNHYPLAKVMIADDEGGNVKILERILRGAGYVNIHSTTNPAEVARLYKELRPDILLLDLRMPETDGFRLMDQLRDIERDYLPILVLTAQRDRETQLRALRSGAKDLLHKPFDVSEVLMRINNIVEVRMLHNSVRDQNKVLEEKVAERTQELTLTRMEVIYRLGRASEYRDNETGMHIIRMSRLSAKLAQAIGLSQEECDLILNASPMHDVGKIGIPDAILLKPGRLTPEEWKIMKLHPSIGAEILSGSGTELLRMAELIALTHQERWDGSGYPAGLKGEEIPLVGRIVALCDVFDALTSKRPYKAAFSVEETMSEIEKQSGVHFDPFLVEAFKRVLPDMLQIAQEYADSEHETAGKSKLKELAAMHKGETL